MEKNRMPTAFTILFGLIVLVAISTYLIPAGQYNVLADGEPIAGTYHTVAQHGQNIGSILKAPLEGLYDAIDIAAFILMVGGFLGIVMETGAIDTGIRSVVRRLHGREKYMIPILMFIFALGGTTFGMWEETMAFFPLLLPIFLAAGYDTVVPVAVVLLGAGVGSLGSTVNPFATGIAAGFAGVRLSDGMILRLIMLAVFLVTAIYFVMRYAERVRQHPETSVVAAYREEHRAFFLDKKKGENDEDAPLTIRQKLVLWIFAAVFLIMVYSVIPFDDMGLDFLPTLSWWFPELSALFLAGALLAGICYGMSEKALVANFLNGTKDLLSVAFIIGISRGIIVIMNNGMITDTILYWGESALQGTAGWGFILLSYLIYIPLAFLIPSSSGLATLVTPIMSPLADFSGVSRALSITAFQSASGFLNLFTPTSAVIMGALALGRIPYNRWLKFSWRYLLFVFLANAAFLAAGALIPGLS